MGRPHKDLIKTLFDFSHKIQYNNIIVNKKKKRKIRRKPQSLGGNLIGYYTNFEVTIDKVRETKTTLAEVAKEFENSLGCPFMDVYEEGDSTGSKPYACGDYKAKWYNFDRDLRKIAERYPEFLIEIDRRGEDYEDWSAIRVFDGKIETRRAIIKSPWEQF